MLRRQDSCSLQLSSTSTHLQTPPPPENHHHAKPIGCLSAVFRLISKYHNRKKLLTFGKKNPKNAVSTQKDSPEPTDSSALVLKEDNHDLKKHDPNLESTRLTRDVTPRSPTLPPEIRRRPSDAASSENAKTPRALVARLMGLDPQEEPKLQPKKQPAALPAGDETLQEKELISNEEKRRKILQALEKCNEDLESLKKIIMAVQLGDEHNQQSEVFKPRPVSGTGDDIGRSPPWSRNNYTKLNSNAFTPQQQKKKLLGKKPGGGEDGLFNKVHAESFKTKPKIATPNFWSSRAMIESVDEVCDDVSWGEKREQRNLEMVLDNYISRDLIEEVVFELGFRRIHRLPFEACRRRISF